MKKLCYYFLLLCFVAGCAGPGKISNINLAYRYSPGLNFISPEYIFSSLDSDSVRVMMNVNASDLTFVNKDTTLICSFAVSYSLFADMESKVAIDTGTAYFNFPKPSLEGLHFRPYFDIPVASGSSESIRIDFTDINRQQAVTDIRTVDRSGNQSPLDFILIDADYNIPVSNSFTDHDMHSRVRLAGNRIDTVVYMRYFKGRYPIASPPFADEKAITLSYSADQTSLLKMGSNDTFSIDKEGIYHLQFDTLVPSGYSFFRFRQDFPLLTSAEDLLESVRYITTREEFAKISSSKDIKSAVDEFWLIKAGNRERARQLIKAYYTRVQTANMLFTSYLEGWKSDRGLIFVIFGPPSSVFRSNKSETWLYSQTTGQGTLSFVFEKKKNPFTENDYMLRRNPYYDIPWYRAVETWRDGRVYNDGF